MLLAARQLQGLAAALTLVTDRTLDTTLSQNAMRFHGRVAVDEHYNGLALDAGEGERIARAMDGAGRCSGRGEHQSGARLSTSDRGSWRRAGAGPGGAEGGLGTTRG